MDWNCSSEPNANIEAKWGDLLGQAVDATLGDDILQGTCLCTHIQKKKWNAEKCWIHCYQTNKQKKDWITLNVFFLEDQEMVKEILARMTTTNDIRQLLDLIGNVLAEECKFPGLQIFHACKFGHLSQQICVNITFGWIAFDFQWHIWFGLVQCPFPWHCLININKWCWFDSIAQTKTDCIMQVMLDCKQYNLLSTQCNWRQVHCWQRGMDEMRSRYG